MSQDGALELLVLQARGGDKQALESLILAVQRHVYNLALRMLPTPMDAEDASQEILIKVITHLTEFRAESTFTTWVYFQALALFVLVAIVMPLGDAALVASQGGALPIVIRHLFIALFLLTTWFMLRRWINRAAPDVAA